MDPCLVTTTGASRVAELNSTVVPVNKKRKVLWHQAIHKKIVRVSFCKKRTISWQKVIKQCKLSSVLTRSCSNERKKSNQNVKQTWKVWHFPWGRGLGGWWFYEKKTSLREVLWQKLFKVTCRSQQVGCSGWSGWCRRHPLCFPIIVFPFLYFMFNFLLIWQITPQRRFLYVSRFHKGVIQACTLESYQICTW